jgi:hypothetical protein
MQVTPTDKSGYFVSYSEVTMNGRIRLEDYSVPDV